MCFLIVSLNDYVYIVELYFFNSIFPITYLGGTGQVVLQLCLIFFNNPSQLCSF